MPLTHQSTSKRFTLELLNHSGLDSLTTIMFGSIKFAHLPVVLTTSELFELVNLLNSWAENADQAGRVVTRRFSCDLCPSPGGSAEEFLTVLTLRQTHYSQQSLPVIFTPREVSEFREALWSWRMGLPEQAPADDSSLQALDQATQLLLEFIS